MPCRDPLVCLIFFLTDNITCDIIRTMSKADKLLERMRNNPQGWRIEDVKTVARRFKMLVRAKGGSHHVVGFPFIDEAVSIPAHKPIKAVYIIRFLELIDKIKEV
jgi:hypothetical protein